MGGGNQRLVQILIWFGQNSLCLMLVHPLIKTYLEEYFECMFANHFVFMVVQLLLTILFSIVLTILIKKYTPFLIGKNRNVTR